jgi:large subunit ribosomal protein L9
VKYNNKKGEIMRVVFLQDVPNVAKAGEIKEVANGYGRNFLIPKKLALLAKPQAIKQVETGDIAKARVNAELTALAGQLEGKEVILKAKAGAKDRLYGSITSADIASELNNVSGLAIDKRRIEFEPIHRLGSYEVTIRLAKDILPKIKVTVAEEETPKEEEKAPKKKRTPKKEEKTQEEKKKVSKKKAPKKEEKAQEEKAQEEKAPKKKRTPKKEEKTQEEKVQEEKEKAPKKKRTPKKEEKT